MPRGALGQMSIGTTTARPASPAAGRPGRDGVLVLGIAGAYFVAAKLGLTMAFLAEQVTPVWPPTGIALAATLLFGYRVWPGIWLGAFLANATAHEPILTAVGIAVGNTLEALIGAWLLRRLPGFQRSLDRLIDVLGLVVLAALGSTLVSAAIGTTSLVLGGLQPWSAFADLFWVWWVGDAMGDLVMAPVLLTWSGGLPRPSSRRPTELLILVASLVAASLTVFVGPLGGMATRHPLEYVVFPFVIWAAVRFGQPGTTTVAFVASAVAIWATVHGSGPFVTGKTHESLILLQLFMGVVSVSGLLLAAAVSERGRAEEAARLSEERLRLALDAASMGSWDLEVAGGAMRWSASLEEIHGLPPGRFGGSLQAHLDGVHPEDRERVRGAIARSIDAGVDHDLEYRIVRPDGKIRWLQARGHVTPDQTGRAVRITGLCTDVTNRKEAGATLYQLAAIVDSSDDAIIGKTLDGVITSWNQAASRMYGYSAAEALGRPISILAPPDTTDELPEILERLRRGQRIDQYETERVRKDGTRLYVSVTISPTKDATGRIVGASAIARDISERKRIEAERAAALDREQAARAEAEGNFALLQESEARFRGLANAVPGILFTSRPDGWSDYTSPRFYEYTGMPPGSAEGYGWVAAVPPADREQAAARWAAAVAEGQPFDVEYRFRSPRGGHRWFLTRSVPMRDERGRIVKWFGACIDIDAQKRAEEALQQANVAKDKFLAMLGHELRNPLAAINHAVAVLGRHDAKDEGVARMASIIGRQSRHLARLLDDLLDVSRLASGKITLRRVAVDLMDVMEQALGSLQAAGKGADHDIRLLGERVGVEGDPTRLAQVVTNLLENAVKFTPPGGRIAVTVQPEGGQAVVRVKDDGIGIAPGMLAQVFDLFAQESQSLDRAQGGLGVGLALVKHLVEMHGGTVSASSPGPNAGSEFSVRLPRLDRTVDPGPLRRARGDSGGRRVLVIEDHADARDALRTLLESEGHEVEVAEDGRTGLEKLRRLRPDVALIDVGLPGLDGLAIARAIRGTPAARDTVLVAVTGYGQPEDRRRALEAGFHSFLVKPVDPDELARVLERQPGSQAV